MVISSEPGIKLSSVINIGLRHITVCGASYPPWYTVYPKKYAHGFVVLCFVVVMQSFIINSHQVLIHIHQGCFDGTGAIVRLAQCQWSKPDGYGKISQCITTTKQKQCAYFLGYTVHVSIDVYLAVLMFKDSFSLFWEVSKDDVTVHKHD